jgi:hypothetical protein
MRGKPSLNGGKVSIGKSYPWVNAVQKCVAWMVGGYPGSVSVADLVVDPHEGSSTRPGDQGLGLPVQPAGRLLLVALRPVDDRQFW